MTVACNHDFLHQRPRQYYWFVRMHNPKPNRMPRIIGQVDRLSGDGFRLPDGGTRLFIDHTSSLDCESDGFYSLALAPGRHTIIFGSLALVPRSFTLNVRPGDSIRLDVRLESSRQTVE